MQIIKPRCLGLISKTYGLGEFKTAFGALSFFALDKENILLQESHQWPLITESLGQSQVLDMGFAKPHGEVLLAGKVHTKDQALLSQCEVSLMVGEKHTLDTNQVVDKTLKIVGDRCLRKGWFRRVSKIEKFSSKAIEYERAYGGQKVANNPQGVGGKGAPEVAPKIAKNAYALPNFYYPTDSHHHRSKPKQPAGFGPLNITLPQRAKYQGTYDERWLKEQHPSFPLDTDPILFASAPQDQQMADFISPTCPFYLQGFHPKQHLIEGKLPNIRVRVIVQQLSEETLSYKNVDTQIDTLWFFPEHMLGVAIHRGVIPVSDVDGLDIKQLLLACEYADDPAKPLEHYQQQLQQRTEASSALNSLLNEAPIMPQKTSAQIAKRQALIDQAKVEQAVRKQQMVAGLQKQHPQLAMVQASADKQESDVSPQGELADLASIPMELLAEFDFDLEPILAKSNELLEKAKEQHKKLEADSRKLMKKTPEVETFEQMHARVHTPVMFDSPAGSPRDSASNEEKIKQANALLAITQRQTRQLSPENTLLELATSTVAGTQIKEWVLELLKNGQTLAGRDLAGADLSGMDLAKQDMRQVMLEGANLSNCNFHMADLSGAVLSEANIQGGDFSGSDLSHANLSASYGDKPLFDRSTLHNTQIIKVEWKNASFKHSQWRNVTGLEACLSAADFSDAKLVDCHLIKCNFKSSIWQTTDIQACVLFETNLQHGVFEQTKLHRCVMVGALCENTVWKGADCSLLQLGPESQWRQADFSASTWRSCGFRQLLLTSCDAKDALFIECDFSHAVWSSANLQGSTFHACLMGDAHFSQIDWKSSLLHQSNLRKVTAHEVDWTDTTMREVDTDQGQFSYCRTNGLAQTPAPKNPIPEMEANYE
jgi:uncharacterized protein YjbI with pentapeptide repeats